MKLKYNKCDLMPKVVPEYKEIAKSKIIQAAIKVFSKKGYHGSKMDEIAEEVGVSKATLYTYFKSKEDILQAIWISSNQTLDFKKSFEGQDYQEVLEELYNIMSESSGIHLSFEITALSAHNENIKKINKKAYEEKMEALKRYLEIQQENGLIKKDINADVLTQILTALYTDVATQLLIGIDKTEVHKNWKKSVQFIFKIIK